MKFFYSDKIKELDSITIKEQGITSLQLMERAAEAAADEITARWTIHTPFVVFAGPGNNGGDALAIARILASAGYETTTYLFNPKGTLSPDCTKNKEALEKVENHTLHEITKSFDPPQLTEETVIIDGLFGIGLKEVVTGGFASVIQYINSSPSSVIAIDMPSGLFAEDNSQNSNRNIIKAQLTLTMQVPKLAFMFAENEKYTGEVVILDIQLSQEALKKTTSPLLMTELYDAKQYLKTRNRFAHKGHFGHGLLIAGSYGMMGSVVLAAKACMNSGIGRLTVFGPEAGYTTMQSSVPEAMFKADKNPRIITDAGDVTGYTNVAFGPGLGTDERTIEAVANFSRNLGRPCVIDADGINILASNPELLKSIPSHSILTPHPKEFDRLFGESTNSYERLCTAMESAMRHNFYIVLKGAYTAVCTPSGYVHFNTSGNPGMATAGSGDVLTGILLALLAQNYRPEEVAILGVYIHGLAADIALSKGSEESLLASDIIANIGHAFRQLRLA